MSRRSLSRISISRSCRSRSCRSLSDIYRCSSYFITPMGRSGLYSSEGRCSSLWEYNSGLGLLASICRDGPTLWYGFCGLAGLGGPVLAAMRPGSLLCSATVSGGPLCGYACGVPYRGSSGVELYAGGEATAAVLGSRLSYTRWWSGVCGRRKAAYSDADVGCIRGDACKAWLYAGPGAAEEADEAYWGGTAGSLVGGGPPSMDDIDILLPELPVLGSDSSAGSSRPRGNVVGGPTDRGGGRGCGRL